MRITAICNLKGGVAKTTTAANMADILARMMQKRVLLVDADSQCNLSEFFGKTHEIMNLVDILKSPEHTNIRGAIYHTEHRGIDIIPADDMLMDLDLSAMEGGRVRADALRIALGKVKDEYDYCLIDCPPAFNAASAAALVAADDVLIPIKLDAFSMRGMDNLLRQIRNMQKINKHLEVCGFLPTMFYHSGNTHTARNILENSGYHVFPWIRRSDKVDAMTYAQEPICISSPKSAAAQDYRRFVAMYGEG